MLTDALKKRFKDAESDGWQGYCFLGFPKRGQDPRQHCFDRLTATADAITDVLCARAEQFLAMNSLWFEEEMGNLCEEVGWDFFPKHAAEFVLKLVVEMESKPLPDDAHLRRLQRCSLQPVEDLAFSDVDY